MAEIHRLHRVLDRFAQIVPELEDMQSKISKQRLENMARVYAENVWNNQVQAGGHIGTAGLCIAAAFMGGRFGIDSSSSVSIATKTGETFSTWVRSWETANQGELRRIEHELNKGPEKRYSEFFQQFMRHLDTLSELRHRARTI